MQYFRSPAARGKLVQVIPNICFPAGRAVMKVILCKIPFDLFHEGFGYKGRTTFHAGLHFHRSDWALGEYLKDILQADLVPEGCGVFRTDIDAGTARDTLIMGIIEGPRVPQVL